MSLKNSCGLEFGFRFSIGVNIPASSGFIILSTFLNKKVTHQWQIVMSSDPPSI